MFRFAFLISSFLLWIVVGTAHAVHDSDSVIISVEDFATKLLNTEFHSSTTPLMQQEILIHKSIANSELDETRRLIDEFPLESGVVEVYTFQLAAMESQSTEDNKAEAWLKSCAESKPAPIAIRCSLALADLALVNRDSNKLLQHAEEGAELLRDLDQESEFYLLAKVLVSEWLYLAFLHDRNIEESVAAANQYIDAALIAGVEPNKYHMINNLILLIEKEHNSAKALSLLQSVFPDLSAVPEAHEETILFTLSRVSIGAGELELAEETLRRLQKIAVNEHLILAQSYLSAYVFAKNGKLDEAREFISEAEEKLGGELDNKLGLFVLKGKKEIAIAEGDLSAALEIDHRIDKLEKTISESNLSTERARISGNILLVNEKFKSNEEQHKLQQEIFEQQQRAQRIMLMAAILAALAAILFAVNQTRNRDKVASLNVELHDKNKDLENANTELSELHVELEDALSKAMAGIESRENFIGIIGHELRTPLNPIINLADILLKRNVGSEDYIFLKEIKNSGHRLHMIIENILALTMADNLDRLYVEEFDPVRLCLDICKTYEDSILAKKEKLKRRGQSFDFTVGKSKDFPDKIKGSKVVLTLIFKNLLDNALKFTEAGSVSVVLRKGAAGVDYVLEVTDTGLGMDVDNIDHYFESFTQKEMGMTRSFEGAGLGLSVVKRMSEKVEATVQVESREQKGTTIRVHFPVPKYNVDSGLIELAA